MQIWCLFLSCAYSSERMQVPNCVKYTLVISCLPLCQLCTKCRLQEALSCFCYFLKKFLICKNFSVQLQRIKTTVCVPIKKNNLPDQEMFCMDSHNPIQIGLNVTSVINKGHSVTERSESKNKIIDSLGHMSISSIIFHFLKYIP